MLCCQILLFAFIATSDLCSATSISNEYHEFFLAFPSSGEHAQLYIDVTTYEVDPVELLITDKTGDVLFNLTVDPGEFTNITVPLQYKVTFPFDPDRFKGLHLSTVNDTKVVVYGTVWDPISGSGDSFLALPCVSVLLLEYVYYAVTSNRSNPYMLLVGSQDYTVVEVTPTVTVNVYPDLHLVDKATTTTVIYSGETVRFFIGRLETILLLCIGFGTSLTGSHVKTNQPIAFYSGDLCNDYVVCRKNWNHFSIEQLPQVASWGTRYFTAPIGVSNVLVVLSSDDSNHLSVGCNAAEDRQSTTKYRNMTVGIAEHFKVDGTKFCIVISEKPVIVVMQNAVNGSSAVMPSVYNYMDRYRISSSVFPSIAGKKGSGLRLAVLINASDYQPERISFSRYAKGNNILCPNNKYGRCGFGYTTELLDGETYTVTHTDGVLAVIAYHPGNATTASFALPLGNAFLTGPGPVTNLSVTATNSSTLFISWDPPSYISGGDMLTYVYTLDCSTSENSLVHEEALPPNTKNWTVTDLLPGYPYNVTVFASNTTVEGEPTSVVTFVKQLVPSALSNVSTKRISGTSIFVNWTLLTLTEAMGFVDNYTISVMEGKDYLVEVTVGGSENNATVSGLSVAGSYEVSIRAATAAGYGSASKPTTVSATESALFQLNFIGVGECVRWTSDSACHALDTLPVVKHISVTCRCMFTDIYVINSDAHCLTNSSNDITFTATMYSPSEDIHISSLIGIVSDWVASNSSVSVAGFKLFVNPECPVEVGSSEDLCYGQQTCACDSALVVIGGAMGSCALVIALVFCANVSWFKRKRCQDCAKKLDSVVKEKRVKRTRVPTSESGRELAVRDRGQLAFSPMEEEEEEEEMESEQQQGDEYASLD